MNRKENERYANEFDMQLYRLISKAQERAEAGDAFSNLWATVRWALIDARPTVRHMMDPKDRAVTS